MNVQEDYSRNIYIISLSSTNYVISEAETEQNFMQQGYMFISENKVQF